MRDFIIIGAAQAGLSMAYYLEQLQQDYLVIDKEDEIGASWLNRWDSLTLFTPTEFNHMAGMDFPAKKGHYPNKYEVAEYFKTYVKKFNIPVQLNTLVQKIEKQADKFILTTNQGNLACKQVIIATGPFHIPYTPPCSKLIASNIFQIHSNYYKNPSQLQDGPAMVVGAGDSGFQILDEISKNGRKTYFSGDTDVKTLPQEILGKTLWWWFTKSGFLSFSKNSWIGKKITHSKQPVIGTDVKKILGRKQVIAVGRTNAAQEEIIETEKQQLTDVKNIIWATGYRPNFSWIDGLELDHEGYPVHQRGVSSIKGLYFIGLPWLHTRGSATLGGIKKDAEYLAKQIKKETV
ncbi:putative flavoprotein involved in K+ transport [Mesonia phycicola]|uniref:Putative flavoprotein involved in K+ transport n=1 Tax=Mesonia phycicola TaxID=579105 RepID=A0A1M6GLX0_9FLAO|nr:NAD(P)/FAD-dependent oxidoreductase [Mesonia phycicola]SHJ10944.1 putative flavoprotein involved in K+ transport [Mesonia phycicola]